MHEFPWQGGPQAYQELPAAWKDCSLAQSGVALGVPMGPEACGVARAQPGKTTVWYRSKWREQQPQLHALLGVGSGVGGIGGGFSELGMQGHQGFREIVGWWVGVGLFRA